MEYKNLEKKVVSLVGGHPYSTYPPELRLGEKVKELKRILSSKRGSARKRAQQFLNKMLHLCAAYEIGAKKNNAPYSPAHLAYNNSSIEKVEGVSKRDLERDRYYVGHFIPDKQGYKSLRDVLSETRDLDESLICKYIDFLFPRIKKD